MSQARTKILYLVSLATFLRSFGQVIYTPSLVTMRQELQTSTALIGLSLSVYGLVLAAGQILYGPIVDRFDSKRILVISMGIFMLASFGGFASDRIGLLLVVRALQAVGIAAAASVGIALITDLYPQDERGKAMGVFETFNAAGAAAGPAFGALMGMFFSWRFDFIILGFIGLVVIISSTRYLPSQTAHPQRVGVAKMAMIVSTPSTLGALILGFVQFYGLYTFHTLLPVLLPEKFGFSEGAIGLILALLPLGAISGALLGGRISDRWGSRTTLLVGALGTVFTFSTLTFLTGGFLGVMPISLVVALVILHGFATGFGLPVQIKVMVDNFPKIRGTAGALQYFARFLGSTVAPVLVGYLVDRFNLMTGFASATALVTTGLFFTYLLIDKPTTETVTISAD